jgi:hypothetical protein
VSLFPNPKGNNEKACKGCEAKVYFAVISSLFTLENLQPLKTIMTTRSSASSEMDPLLGGSSCNHKTITTTSSNASSEMDPLLGESRRAPEQGLVIEREVEMILKNPASALVYDEEGFIDFAANEPGLEQIYDAGKALQEAMEHSAGLTFVANNFCRALAQIIVTVMEQSRTEVVAGSNYGKVSKSDTHEIIAKKIRNAGLHQAD